MQVVGRWRKHEHRHRVRWRAVLSDFSINKYWLNHGVLGRPCQLTREVLANQILQIALASRQHGAGETEGAFPRVGTAPIRGRRAPAACPSKRCGRASTLSPVFSSSARSSRMPPLRGPDATRRRNQAWHDTRPGQVPIARAGAGSGKPVDLGCERASAAHQKRRPVTRRARLRAYSAMLPSLVPSASLRMSMAGVSVPNTSSRRMRMRSISGRLKPDWTENAAS